MAPEMCMSARVMQGRKSEWDMCDGYVNAFLEKKRQKIKDDAGTPHPQHSIPARYSSELRQPTTNTFLAMEAHSCTK